MLGTIFVWLLIGFICTLIISLTSWLEGDDFTVEHLLVAIVCILLGPVTIMFLLMILIELLSKFNNKYKDVVIFKGFKRKGKNK
jgi:1,4-dihydroxy-2-naphthoate octaprenyltransferase